MLMPEGTIVTILAHAGDEAFELDPNKKICSCWRSLKPNVVSSSALLTCLD
jgi:hypothetical protein